MFGMFVVTITTAITTTTTTTTTKGLNPSGSSVLLHLAKVDVASSKVGSADR